MHIYNVHVGGPIFQELEFAPKKVSIRGTIEYTK